MNELADLQRLERATERIAGRLTEVERLVTVDGVHRVNVEKRLSSIEDTLRWLVKLIIGALVMAIVAFALRGGFLNV